MHILSLRPLAYKHRAVVMNSAPSRCSVLTLSVLIAIGRSQRQQLLADVIQMVENAMVWHQSAILSNSSC